MSHPSIAPDHARAGPLTLLHSEPNTATRSGKAFENALDQAKQQENPPPATESAADAPARPDEKTPNTPAPPGGTNTSRENASDNAGAADDDTTGTENTAALPAGIAAILAKLASTDETSGKTLAEAADAASDARSGKLSGAQAGALALFDGSGPRGNAADTAIRLVSGKAGLALESTESAINPDADASPTARASLHATTPFAARLEAVQQTPQLQVALDAGHRGWAAEVGNHVSWMIGRNEARAELQLTPPSLGKLGVSIQVSGEQTTAHFVAASQAARDALEQAMPRLREVLQQAGIQLGETYVSTSGGQSSYGDEAPPGSNAFSRANASDESPAMSMPATFSASALRGGNGLVDTFA